MNGPSNAKNVEILKQSTLFEPTSMILSNDPTRQERKKPPDGTHGNNVMIMEKPGVDRDTYAVHARFAVAVQQQQGHCNFTTKWKNRTEDEANVH